MKRYNVEIFDRNFNLLSHTNASGVSYSEDYLSPASNEITVPDCAARKWDYIRIMGEAGDFFGIITAVEVRDSRIMTIKFGSFLSIFDTDVLFDTDLQGTSTLEAVMADMISRMFVTNADPSMNIPGLSVATEGSTTGWGFNLKSDTAEKHHCIVNLYNTFVVRALEKYSVVITAVPNVQARTITLTIGRTPDSMWKIETDLPNIIEKNIVIKGTDKDVNKLVVYDTADYATNRVYYRHTDDTYSMQDADRIMPVVQEIHAVDVEENAVFETVADSEAAEVFGNIKFNNLIELIVKNDDMLVNAQGAKIGQVAEIISKGTRYESILTGKSVADRTKLTFGLIRLDLTKIIKRRYG